MSSSDLLIPFFHHLEVELNKPAAPTGDVLPVADTTAEQVNTTQMWDLFDFEVWNDWPVRTEIDSRAFSLDAFA